MSRGGSRTVPAGDLTHLRAAIFDLDGVITDTAEYHYLGWKRLADEEGWPFDREANEQLRGVSRMDSLDLLLDGREATEEQKQAWAERKNAYYVESLEQVTPDDLLPGALETVLACKEEGLAVAIGSSSKNARLVLDRLEVTELFDAISDGHSVDRAKPAPDLFLDAAERLGVEPSRCVVFEDAESGVDAALAAGMVAVGIGPAERVGHATVRFDTVADVDLEPLLHPDGPRDQHLQNNLIIQSGWEVRERVLEPEQIITTGSNYLIGNGYLGYRGTFPEWTADEYVGCIVSDTYDCADGTWKELCNAPNALYGRWSVDGEPVEMHPRALEGVAGYERELNVRYGVHRRSWSRRGPGTNLLHLFDERFASYDDLHVIPQRQVVRAEEPVELTLVTGIDGQVWNLNGDHFASCEPSDDGDELLMEAVTVEEGVELVVAQALTIDGPEPVATRSWTEYRRALRELTFELDAGEELVVETTMAVRSSNDGPDPRAEVLERARAVAAKGYLRAKAEHTVHWDRRWRGLDIRIDGDLAAQTVLRYNLYQATIATPTHTDHLPIGARGLSCQAYQGGAFWDQEIFNLPMWLYTEPEQARSILAYRHRTLDGARRKAQNLGYEGAFYAWVSGLTGDELCPSYFFEDVISGRPIRNHFNDWQIHVSPDIAHAIWQYERATGDWDFIEQHGAEMLFEIARFCVSRVHLNPVKGHYEVIRVLGPDEYHENVDNNAFTNYQIHTALDRAITVYERLAAQSPERLSELVADLDLDDEEITRWRDVRERIYLPAADPDTGLVAQFDGYFDLEDTTPEALRERLIDPGEYWGWPNGVAVETQVLKQADVLQLLLMHWDRFTREDIAANYDYYEPRTQHGSSLSPSTYSIVANRIGRHREAHRMFMVSCGTDLFTRESKVSGGTFIGGIRTAACGAAWQIVTRGFAGLRVKQDSLELDPATPEHWHRLAFGLQWHDRWLDVDVRGDEVRLRASEDNPGDVPLAVWGHTLRLAPGAQETLTR